MFSGNPTRCFHHRQASSCGGHCPQAPDTFSSRKEATQICQATCRFLVFVSAPMLSGNPTKRYHHRQAENGHAVSQASNFLRRASGLSRSARMFSGNPTRCFHHRHANSCSACCPQAPDTFSSTGEATQFCEPTCLCLVFVSAPMLSGNPTKRHHHRQAEKQTCIFASKQLPATCLWLVLISTDVQWESDDTTHHRQA